LRKCFHEIEASPGRVGFIAVEIVRRTGRQAESAMDALLKEVLVFVLEC
jgi:hypothetical protein